MSSQEIEVLSKAELKNRLSNMGMSLDKDDHPRDYYVQLYLEKSNAKNKITRDNTPFYKPELLRGKRERVKEKINDKELLDDPNYEEEENEEDEEIYDDHDEDYVYEESENIDDNKEERKKYYTKKKSSKKEKMEIDEKNLDYRESGIKITRLIRMRKRKEPKTKKFIIENKNSQNNAKRKILNNYEEMAGQNNSKDNYNSGKYIYGENSAKYSMNLGQNYSNKNNEYYQYNNNLPVKNNDVISLKVETLNNYGRNSNRNEYIDDNMNYEQKEYKKVYYAKPNEPSQYSEKEIKEKSFVSFGAPNDSQTNINLLSNGPVSFGFKQNSVTSKNKENNKYQNNNGNKSQKYDYFIKSITESIKEDNNEKQNRLKPKTVLVRWDTPKQKEFLCSSMQKEDIFNRSLNDDINNMNDNNKINLQSKFETKERIPLYGKAYANPSKDQIVTYSIQNTTIIESYNLNKDYDSNDYKTKLRSYKNKNYNNNEIIENNVNKLENDNKSINYTMRNKDFNNYNNQGNTFIKANKNIDNNIKDNINTKYYEGKEVDN